MTLLQRLLNAPRGAQSVAALGFALAGALLLGWVAIAVVEALVARHDGLHEARERAGRLAALAATTRLPPPDAEPTGGPAPDLFMAATHLAIARAELQQRVAAIAKAQGCFVASLATLPDMVDVGATMIGLRVDFSGSDAAVMATIAALERSLPPLIAKRLAIHAAAGAGPDRPVDLAAELHVFVAVRLVPPPAAAMERAR